MWQKTSEPQRATSVDPSEHHQPGCRHADQRNHPPPPTRRYTVTFIDGTRVDVDAEGMWPVSNTLEFVVTIAVIGIPRQLVTRRALLREVASVEREDGAVWSA